MRTRKYHQSLSHLRRRHVQLFFKLCAEKELNICESSGRRRDQGICATRQSGSAQRYWFSKDDERLLRIDNLYLEEVNDSDYELTANELSSLVKQQESNSHRQNTRPLMTSKLRNEEARRKRKDKLAKFPITTVRIRCPDCYILQTTFPSTDPIKHLYAFVQQHLAPSVNSFTLSMICQPLPGILSLKCK